MRMAICRNAPRFRGKRRVIKLFPAKMITIIDNILYNARRFVKSEIRLIIREKRTIEQNQRDFPLNKILNFNI